MKRIKSTLVAARMLGIFGFILVLAVIIIGLSIYNIFLLDEGIVAIREQSERRFALESAEYSLLEQEMAERSFILFDGDPVYVEEFGSAGERTAEYFDRLIELSDERQDNEIALLQDDVASVEEDFNIIVNMFEEAGSREALEEEYGEELDAIFLEEGEIDQQLNDLVFDTELRLAQAVEDLKHDNQNAVLYGIIALILFPALAVWAFMVASQLTQPILRLTNAVVAIGGGHYREVLVDTVLDRGGSLGALAKQIDHMADHVNAREAELEEEVQSLRTQLHESRRRKLVLTASVRSREE